MIWTSLERVISKIVICIHVNNFVTYDKDTLETMKTLPFGSWQTSTGPRGPKAMQGILKNNCLMCFGGQYPSRQAKCHFPRKTRYTAFTTRHPHYLHDYLTDSGFSNSLVLHWGPAEGWVAVAAPRHSGWRLWRTFPKPSATKCTQKIWNFSTFQNFENPYLRDGWGKIGSEGVPELEIP